MSGSVNSSGLIGGITKVAWKINSACVHHLNGRVELRVAVWRHRSKSVCAGLACCRLSWTAALSVTTSAHAALYK